MRRTTSALAALMLGLLASGCGKSKQHEILDQLQAECEALVKSHATFREAEIDFRGAYPNVFGPDCRPDFLALPSNDTCAPASVATPVCSVEYAYPTTDPTLCSGGRCGYVCEIRMMQADLQAALAASDLTLAPICASRWVPHAF
jgi:hypothetical protein